MFIRIGLLVGIFLATASLLAVPMPPQPSTSSWPMFGGTPARNMVNFVDTNIADDFDPQKEGSVLWLSQLGGRSYGGPIIAEGCVIVGTNNDAPRNPRDIAINVDFVGEPLDKGVLMCFRARDGKFLWQAVHDKLASGQVNDWPREGIASTPTIEGTRVYYVSNRAEIVCVDLLGLANGNQGFQDEKYTKETDGDVIWSFDMIKELKVFPHNLAAGSPLIVGDTLFVVTGNGVDEGHVNLPHPDAPSFVALDKTTGKLLWSDKSPGKNIMHAQWGNPSYAAGPVPQVLFPGGDGWLRAFDPRNGQLLWKFDGNPKDATYELGGTGRKNDFVLTAPAIDRGRAYFGLGQDPEHTTGHSDFWCIDLKKAVEKGRTAKDRDVSPRENNFDGAAAVNRDSALVWHFGAEDNRQWAQREFTFGRTLSTACIVGDVVYIAELAGHLHCLDARTGTEYWWYDTKSSIWGSPYYADGKVYLATESGDLFIFQHDPRPFTLDPIAVAMGAPDKRLARQSRVQACKYIESRVLLRRIEFDAPIRSTPVVASGVLFVMTEKALYAIEKKRK